MSRDKYTAADEAVSIIRSGDRVFIQGSAVTTLHLLAALERRAAELRDVELVNISIHGDAGINRPKYADSFHFNALFVSAPSAIICGSLPRR